jgi:transposase-like protein
MSEQTSLPKTSLAISHAAMPNQLSFRYFQTSPEIIQLAVMLYVKFPLSLRNVEDLLHERGVDISYESVRYWWHRFGPKFASEIKKFFFTAKDRFRDRFFKKIPQ